MHVANVCPSSSIKHLLRRALLRGGGGRHVNVSTDSIACSWHLAFSCYLRNAVDHCETFIFKSISAGIHTLSPFFDWKECIISIHSLLISGPEYGTMEAAWKAVLVESDRRCDLHTRVKDDLQLKVNNELKSWQKETYHKVSELWWCKRCIRVCSKWERKRKKKKETFLIGLSDP